MVRGPMIAEVTPFSARKHELLDGVEIAPIGPAVHVEAGRGRAAEAGPNEESLR